MIIEQSSEQESPVIHLWRRKEGLKVHEVIRDFRPYFYVLENDVKINDNRIVEEKKGFISIKNERCRRITVRNPNDVSILRQFFNTSFEADVQFHLRYLVDHEVDFGEQPKALFLDIEVDFKDKFPEPLLAQEPIVCVTTYNQVNNAYFSIFLSPGKKGVEEKLWVSRINPEVKTRWVVAYCQTEKELLYLFIRHIRKIDPDLITGWNTNLFDLTYIITRMRNLGVNPSPLSPLMSTYVKPPTRRLQTGKFLENPPVIKGRLLFDLLPFYRKMNAGQLESFSLDDVADKELGVKKLKYQGKLRDLYSRDPETLLLYNVSDVELCVKVDDKVRIIQTFWELSKFIGCRIEQTDSESQMIDMYQLRYNRLYRNRVLPTKNPTAPRTFEGATVIEPVPNIYDNCLVLDLEKLYPSIILSCNISPETIVEDKDEVGDFVILPNGMRFRKDDAFSPGVLRKLFEIENYYKKEKSKHKIGSEEYERARRSAQFTKDIRNGYYGVLSYSGSRCYVPDAGASITLVGRLMLDWCVKQVEQQGYKVLGGDTDSLFIMGKSFETPKLIGEAEFLVKVLNSSFDEFAKNLNISKHYFSIDFKNIFEPFLVTAKKRYAGIVSFMKGREEQGFMEVKGFETRRSDNNAFTKSFVHDLLLFMLQKKTRKEIDDFIIEKIGKVKTLPLEELGIRATFHQELKSYNPVTMYVKAALYSNKHLGTTIGKGSKVNFLFVKQVPSGFPFTPYVCFEDSEQISGFIPDTEKIVQRVIINKLLNIFTPLDWATTGIGVAINKKGRIDLGQKTLVFEQLPISIVGGIKC